MGRGGIVVMRLRRRRSPSRSKRGDDVGGCGYFCFFFEIILDSDRLSRSLGLGLGGRSGICFQRGHAACIHRLAVISQYCAYVRQSVFSV